MAPIRLRHPKGVSTLQLPINDDAFSVQDFQQQIYSATDILPSRQDVKTGYPPRPLTLIPELPFSSLGIVAGDQIIVSEIAGSVPPNKTHVSLNQSSSTRAPAVSENLPSPLSSSSGPDFVDTGDGNVLVHRVLPDDNSCLFSAAALVFEQNINKAQDMRRIVADGIETDPETYNEAILGMPPTRYIQTILKSTTWGGAIELGILAKHHKVEISSIDVETGRVDHFSPPESTSTGMRCIVIYSGIHYDAASLAPTANAPNEWHQTLFPISTGEDYKDPVIIAAKKLADILRSKKAYTNTATFDLKCEQCGKGLKGEREARAHAEQTGHVRFGEY
ncbi:Putative ubiquitin thioesterase otu1 [Leucoagaricus sp. SymC.cos]|nr:Putative ubiquitin thioesterase otu1 [Leucoagaricus sp. SymC.cos]